VPATTNLKALNPQGARIHVLLGDLFDRPKVSFETIFFAAEAYREIVQTNPQVEFFILAGNHDLSRDSTHVSALQLFEKMVSVSVLTQPRRIGDDLLAIPWSP
jgi:DNA repair exonuclease SbcCD nuclease subunit